MENVEELQKLAVAAAKRVSYQWPDNVEVDDLAQDIMLRLMETPATVERIFEENEPTRKSFMVRIAHQVASQQQIDYEQFSGNYLYDTVEVRGYLERQVWLLPVDRFRPEIADLTEGLNNLADKGSNHYAEIINRYEYDIVGSGGAARVRTNRAVEALTAEMNRIGATRRKDRIEGPGSRKVVSNLTAGNAVNWYLDSNSENSRTHQ